MVDHRDLRRARGPDRSEERHAVEHVDQAVRGSEAAPDLVEDGRGPDTDPPAPPNDAGPRATGLDREARDGAGAEGHLESGRREVVAEVRDVHLRPARLRVVEIPERQDVDAADPGAVGPLGHLRVDGGLLGISRDGAHGGATTSEVARCGPHRRVPNVPTPVDALTDALPPVGPARALVIPMCDEVARIERTLSALAASSLALDDLELVLVDDGSADDTVAVATAAAASLGCTRGCSSSG